MSSKKGKKQLDLPLGKAPKSEEEIDLSHVKLPIETSVFGLKQVLTLFETATNEVKKYLAFECNILYECRACRTIFRSLANFVLHKRVYCKDRFKDSPDQFEDNLTIISGEILTANEKSTKYESDQEKGCANKLLPVIEKLKEKQELKKFVEETKNEDLSQIVDNKEKFEKKPFNTVILEPIEDTNVAVFQTTLTENEKMGNFELMKDEVMEIHSILDDDEAIIGSDGKILMSLRKKKDSNFPITCPECNQKFTTKRTLVYHVKNKHNDSRIVHPCPECGEDLPTARSVYRHLLKIHKKTSVQVRKIRNQIYNSTVCKKLQQMKTAKKDKNDCGDKNNEENEWLDNIEGDNDLQMCGGCGKRFERKAALQSHSVMCTKRIQVCNIIKENNAKRKEIDEIKKKKMKFKEQFMRGSAKRKPDKLINYKNRTFKILETENKEEDEAKENSEYMELDCEKNLNIGDETEVEVDHRNEETGAESSEEPPQIVEKCQSPFNGFEAELCNPKNDENCAPSPVNIEAEIPEKLDSNSPENCAIEDDKFEMSPNSNEIEIITLALNEEEIEQPLSELKRKRDSPDNSDLENDLKKIKDYSEDDIQNDESFIMKLTPYIDKLNFSCLICECQFSSISHLLLHMSNHFSWFRFQCSKCAFMAYNKLDCESHVHKEHKIPLNKTDNSVLPIPKWKTILMMSRKDSNELKPRPLEIIENLEDITEKKGSTEILNNNDKEVIVGFIDLTEEDAQNEEKIEDDGEELNEEESESRSMSRQEILDVILGSGEKKEENCAVVPNCRPQRNRVKSFKVSQADFIYDMDVIGGKLFK